MKLSLTNIQNDKSGYESLAELYAKAKNFFFENIEIDMKNISWFSADMCAPLGAILYRLGAENINTVKLININAKIKEIIAKNGFLSHYGHSNTRDNWKTTISYRHFDIKDDRAFAEYVEKEFINRPEIPQMSFILNKKFKESIFEIFSNAVLHSNTKLGVFSCGQFFPNKHEIIFSVADLGIGIRENIKQTLGIEISPEEAIVWATTERNTTKRGKVPGGLGLKLLRKFIELNGGSIQIVSEFGYWQQLKDKVTTKKLQNPFPGTVVNIKINTDDEGLYMLSSEITSPDIF